MNQNGKILIIEDNEGDQMLFKEALENLKVINEVLFFSDGESILEYLSKNPRIELFLIISDINLPRLSGIELRQKIYEDKELSLRCIPYLFFTSSSSQKDIIDAYSKSVQGFFVKPYELDKLEIILDIIIKYWSHCQAPNIFDLQKK